ncbi:MAG: Glycosyltransferase, putative [uncultured Thiotrichaceae bacterium]|uniref:Glycosyltransferase, putative n=1 Tax=uncultured Thiotrichaceae bacterium TaxID=298394 RepID=A0A6S6TP93_9GAMM|nr:MAG: Glycosyltransferase, putative [uncultured Thiotrichaceae bacterium]
MRVLFVTNGYPTEDHPEYCVFNKEQVSSIEKRGVEVDVIFINARDYGRSEYVKAIKIIKDKSKNADLIHCFHGLSYLITLLSVGKKVPLVVSFLNAIENEYIEFPKPVSQICSVITKMLVKKNIGMIFKDRVPIWAKTNSLAKNIPNGVNIEQFFPLKRSEAIQALNLDSSKRYVLFVSSKDKFRRQKRYDMFTLVLKNLKADQAFSDVEELCLVNETRDRVPLYFNSASVHLLTSDFEGSPNSVKESMACNTPVVSTNVGNVKEMFQGGEAGCEFVNVGDVDALTESLKNTLGSSERIDLLSVLKNNDLDSVSSAQAVCQLYSEVLSNFATSNKFLSTP